MIAIVHNECRTPGKTGGKLGLEFIPGHGGLDQPRVILGIMCIGKARGGKRPLAFIAPGGNQVSVVRAVIEVGQRV
jgi:hypothetical protein